MIGTALRGLIAPDVSIFHQYVKPPYGGGNQFAIALRKQLRMMGYSVETNRISRSTKACLFNSYNFDFERLLKFRLSRPSCRMIHRVDGPISVYRGRDDGTDKRIYDINQRLADVTIFQSKFSLEKHKELGLHLNNPVIIMNAADPSLFNTNGRKRFEKDRKIKLISTSWSDNPNKGFAVYKWLEEHIDWSRYDYTFVGRTAEKFDRIKTVGPAGSEKLAEILRDHDIYITASKNEPCSNALVEALSCGLPAVYLMSGSHAEVVGSGGEGFASNDEALVAIDKLAQNYMVYQANVAAPVMRDIAAKYIAAMGLKHSEQTR